MFVVDQIDSEIGKFDEHKAMLGFQTEADAKAAYEVGFSDGSGAIRLGAMTMWPAGEFDAQIQNPDRWKSPVGEISAKPAHVDPQSEAASDLSAPVIGSKRGESRKEQSGDQKGDQGSRPRSCRL